MAKEIHPGFILGGHRELDVMLRMQPDVLVPLAQLSAKVWDTGFRGEILYCPIRDFDILPEDVLDRLVEQILERLNAGKRVALFCIGGHGRTGYVAACVLARLGVSKPIEFLRAHYSTRAVETGEQEEAVLRYCERFV